MSAETFTTASDEAGLQRARFAARTQGYLTQADPLDDLKNALDELIEFTAEDAISAGCALPNGRGCRGPDTSTADRLYIKVLEAAERAFAPKQVPAAQAGRKADSGLRTVHNPDRHYPVLLGGESS